MKTIMIMAAAVVGLAAGTARGAEAGEFAGTWLNINPKTEGLTRVEIGIVKSSFTVHIWGSCIPECDWGSVSVLIPSRLGDTFTAQYDRGYATVTLTITLIGATSLHVHKLTDFTPEDGRTDYETDDYFQPEGSGTPRPDLEITGLTIDTPVVVYGATPWTWLTATVRNNGPGVLSAGTIKAVFESCTLNGVPKTHGGYMIFDYTAPLMPGQEVTHDFAVATNSDWPVGCHTIRLMVDPDNAIAESNERNNLSPELKFDVANERFLAGTIRYNGNPLSHYTQVYPAFYGYDLTNHQNIEGNFFWYDTQTGHYLLSGLPDVRIRITIRFRVSGPYEIMADNYTCTHIVDLGLLSDAQAGSHDIELERIMHLLTPWDNSQSRGNDDLDSPVHCPKTEFTWEPLEGAVKYHIDIDIYRDSTHPSGYGFAEHVVDTEIAEATYMTDLPVLADLHQYRMTLEGFNSADQLLGQYMFSYTHPSGSFGGYGWSYRFTVCPSCARADINRDCRVNMLDLAILAEEWLVDTR